ncbi:uncharacterized protein DFL_006411 [Arthrobotrys flagrans]|uniref:Uncharacterized protein n=1 Tax=Arthrobotrys flagrans TaxID=97331 RepID=A0A437A0B9_ARTFL|nr:hypothetical protein DFL_006411 [Arthrobotrys flagrans]
MEVFRPISMLARLGDDLDSGSWLQQKSPDLIGDCGTISPAQTGAQQWLYDLEEGIWEDTGSANTIPDRPRTPHFENVEILTSARMLEQLKTSIDPALDEQGGDDSNISKPDLDVNLLKRPAQVSEAVDENPVVNPSAGTIFNNLESRVQSRAGSRELQDIDEGQIQREDLAVIQSVLNDIINQVEEQQNTPAQEIQNEVIDQNQIPREEVMQEVVNEVINQNRVPREEVRDEVVVNEVVEQPVLQQNNPVPGGLGRIEEVDESEIRSQGAQSLANPSVDSKWDLTSALDELYGGRQPRWLMH